MSRSLYNPFMPSVHFRDRAVFGGGDSNGTIPLSFDEGGTTSSVSIPSSSNKELMKSTSGDEQLKNKYLQDIKTASSYTQEGIDNLALYGRRIQKVQAVPKPNIETKSIAKKVESGYNKTIQALQDKIKNAQGYEGAQLTSGTRDLVKTSLTDPQSLAKAPEVSSVDAEAEGTSIDKDAGTITNSASTVSPDTIASTNVAEGATPITASTMTATTASDAVKEATKSTTAATGTVSDKSLVEAATKDPTTTDVSSITAAQGTATVMDLSLIHI